MNSPWILTTSFVEIHCRNLAITNALPISHDIKSTIQGIGIENSTYQATCTLPQLMKNPSKIYGSHH